MEMSNLDLLQFPNFSTW